MKKSVLIPRLLFISILYFLYTGAAFGVNVSPIPAPSGDYSYSSGDHGDLAKVSFKLISFAIQNERSVSSPRYIRVISLKSSFIVFTAFLKEVAELLLFNVSSQYFFDSGSIIISFHPTDIIYPFHYFW